MAVVDGSELRELALLVLERLEPVLARLLDPAPAGSGDPGSCPLCAVRAALREVPAPADDGAASGASSARRVQHVPVDRAPRPTRVVQRVPVDRPAGGASPC